MLQVLHQVSWRPPPSCSVFVSSWSAAPNAHCECGAQWLLDIYTVLVASGRLTGQKASGTRRAPSIRWEAPPLRHRTLQPSNSWAENPTLRRAARVSTPPWPGYSTLLRAARVPLQPSKCCSHLEQPPQSRNGVGLRHAEGRNS